MNKHEEVCIYLHEEVISEIEDVIKYKRAKDILFSEEDERLNIEDFIVGCVCYYLRQIKNIEKVSGIKTLNKPFKLKNKIKECLDMKEISQSELSERTGIGASNISSIVKNKSQPSLDYFLRIWIELDCPPVSWILYREDS